ncbi:hypothetical protein J6590_047463 [Homalodisca vitripennis]|nr:hypothetical protein J6590_047463 [Homalodisca vitripennis]
MAEEPLELFLFCDLKSKQCYFNLTAERIIEIEEVQKLEENRNNGAETKDAEEGSLDASKKLLRNKPVFHGLWYGHGINRMTNTFKVVRLKGNIYIPPDQPPTKYQNFCDAFDEIMNTAIQPSKIMIMGDFNMPNINCNNLDSSNFSPSYRLILDLASSYDLSQINTVLNFRGVYLDLLLSTDPSLEVELAEYPLLYEDRHHPTLSTTMDTTLPSPITSP